MIGETILHYKILEKLGEGGMGVVYKAEDTELNRLVALKFLPARISYSNEELARLKHEARAAAMLNHPNICTIYAIEEAKGIRFISMEYMDGISLRKKIAEAPMNIDEAFGYAVQIAEALREAHKNGIVHRDIKTENIMINSKNQIKVMDFGVAKLKGSTLEPKYESTYGTLAYMSPEQAVEKPSGYPADIWSYGVVCYEMFTGRLPFIHNYEAAIIYSILNEEPVPPTRIRPDIPPELESIILKCLEKEEEKRYGSAEEIVKSLSVLKKETESKKIREESGKEAGRGVKKAAEQKQATIVYMKIEDYKELINDSSGENPVDLLERYYKAINSAAQKHGGTVNKTNTSEAVLYFGLPEAIENAAYKALSTSIEIKEEFDRIRKEFKLPEKFKLNIAVSSGTVIAGSISSGEKLEYTVIGDVAETALASLEVASNGQILAAQSTYRMLKDSFKFSPYRTISLKGRRDPIKVYEYAAAEAGIESGGQAQSRLIKSDMVGRDGELDRLEYLLLKAMNGEGSIVSIIAEAGIGKSRLINEFKRKRIFERAVLLEGKAESSNKNVSFYPIIEILRQWARISENDNEVQAFSKLEKTVKELCGEEADEVIPFAAVMMGYDVAGDYAKRIGEVTSDAMSKMIQKSMRLLIMKGTELKPAVIILEDLHWADLSSIELTQSLLRLAENNRLLFIISMRPNYLETSDRLLSVIREKYTPFYAEIKITPLNMKDRQLLLHNLLKSKQLPGLLEKAITKSTEGNPFFIEEVIRSLIDESIIEIRNDEFIISQDVESIIIPGSVREVLLARIDKLDERTKYILKVASVIGRYFAYDILKKVAGEYENLDALINDLIKLELIEENRGVAEKEYLFRHALAQESVYETLLAKNRQELHFKVAGAIEDLYSARAADFYELLAHHYSLADSKEKAEEYLIKAGERTLKNAASSEALNYFKEALNIYLQKYGGHVDKEKIYMLEKNIGMLFYNKGYFTDSVEHFGKALKARGIKTEKGNLEELLRLAVNMFSIILKLYLLPIKPRRIPTELDYETFDILYKTANAYANYNAKKMFFGLLNLIKIKMGYVLSGEDGIETYSFASSLFTYSGISFPLGKKFLDKAAAIAQQNKTDELYREGYDETIFKCLTGRWKSFSKINENLLEAKLRAGDLFGAIYQISWALYIIIGKGDYEYAEYLIARGNEIADTYDFDYGKLFILSFQADLELNRRNLHKAVSYYDDSCLLAEKLGLTSWILGLSGKRAKAYMLLNDYHSAKESIDRAEKASIETDTLTPMLLSYFTAYKLFYHIRLFDKCNNEKASKKEIELHEKEILRRRNTALKIANKVAEIKPEVNRLIGNYYRGKKKYKMAYKYYIKSVNYADHLGALPELGRGYLELGSFLSDPEVNIKNKNPENYFEEARMIFEKLNLTWDLDELKRIQNFHTEKQS